jgi:hypothetical protein
MERPQLSPFDDKTLLFRGWSIRKLGLCVKGKGITIYGGLGLSYVKKVCACPPPARNASQREFPNSGTRKQAGRSRPSASQDLGKRSGSGEASGS